MPMKYKYTSKMTKNLLYDVSRAITEITQKLNTVQKYAMFNVVGAGMF
jgi:hypothetical protein